MLTLPEELLLLMSGNNQKSIGISRDAISAGFVAAALMELSIRNRIDSDLESVWVTDNSPTGEAAIDGVLAELSAERLNFEAAELLARLMSFGNAVRKAALTRLEDRKILKINTGLLSRILRDDQISIIDQAEVDELMVRLKQILLSDDFPSPREACLLSLVNTLALADRIVPDADSTQIKTRLATLAKLDLIGRSINGCLEAIFEKVAAVYLSFPRC